MFIEVSLVVEYSKCFCTEREPLIEIDDRKSCLVCTSDFLQ